MLTEPTSSSPSFAVIVAVPSALAVKTPSANVPFVDSYVISSGISAEVPAGETPTILTSVDAPTVTYWSATSIET